MFSGLFRLFLKTGTGIVFAFIEIKLFEWIATLGGSGAKSRLKLYPEVLGPLILLEEVRTGQCALSILSMIFKKCSKWHVLFACFN
jgi:hypothetical protein